MLSSCSSMKTEANGGGGLIMSVVLRNTFHGTLSSITKTREFMYSFMATLLARECLAPLSRIQDLSEGHL
jgi:hypothetical protein